MDWLWLFLGVVGLGLLWLLIVGMEKLTERLKDHDAARRLATKQIAERAAEEEEAFIRKEAAKASARDFIEHGDIGDRSNPANAAALHEAIDTLTSEELVQSVARRMFGTPQGLSGITATQSAFDQAPARKVVAKGEDLTPVKVKSSRKSALSKSEQKMLKKIKQGY